MDDNPEKLFAIAIIAKAGVQDGENIIYTEEALREAADADPALWYEERDQTLRERLDLELVLEPVPYWSIGKEHFERWREFAEKNHGGESSPRGLDI